MTWHYPPLPNFLLLHYLTRVGKKRTADHQPGSQMQKVALITGCSSGLGRALAYRVSSIKDAQGQPVRVFATARKLESLEELRGAGLDCLTLDVSSEASVQQAVQQVIQQAGHIDILINNAGLSRIGPLAEQPLSELQEVLDTNVMGVMRVTQAALPSMISQNTGLVVMVGSVMGMLSSPFAGAYCASKSALLSLTDTLRLELMPFGVGVTYVMAGAMKSDFSDNIERSTDMARYELESSAYRPFADTIRARARMSQDPSMVMPAEEAADRIAAVVEQYVQGGTHRAPPTWFLTGGKAAYFAALGFVQRLFGWPVNSLLAKRFKLLPPSKQ